MSELSPRQERVWAALQDYEGLNFVQRVLQPEAWPRMKLKDGRWGTHKMSTGEWDGKHWVYPEIVMTDDGLEWMQGSDAMNHAAKTGEAIPFDKREDAEWLAKNYKALWGEGE